MLPPQCRWIHTPGQPAYLHFHAACVAVVEPDGRTRLLGWGKYEEHAGRSQRHSMRMVERWVAARKTWPGAASAARVAAMRERMRLAGLPVVRGLD